MGSWTRGHYKAILTLAIVVQAVISTALSVPATGRTEPGQTPSEPPPAVTYNATAQIENLIRQMDEGLVGKHIQKLQDFKTRYSYRGDRCYPASDYIASVFGQNGLNVSFYYFMYGGFRMRNVIGEKTGTASPESIYIICSHYDSISNYAWNDAPGADDNGSGTAAVLAAAEILSDYDFNCTIRFICFSGEEQSMKGSMYYAGEVIGLGENICGVLNIDMIAYNPDPGTSQIYLGKDFGDSLAMINESVYGPAPANDTTVDFWLDHTNILSCTLYIQEQGTPGVYHKMAQGYPGDYTLNLSTGHIDLSAGWGPLAQYENLTAWYNYSPSGSLIEFTKGIMQKYSNIFTLTSVDLLSGSSDHAPFSPSYPSMMLIERRYASNPNYHKVTDTIGYLNLTYGANITQLAMATLAELAQIIPGDGTPPSMSAGYPAEDSYTAALPEISMEITDPSGLNLTALVMQVSGSEVIPILAPISLGYNASYTPSIPFEDGQAVSVSVEAADIHGNIASASWNFTVDAVPPEPPSNFTIEKSRVEFEKQGLAINLGTSYDATYAAKPSVLFREGLYRMWYSGHDSTRYQICYADSADGLTWAKHGVVLSNGTTGDPDSRSAAYPSVIFDGEYKMWYSGYTGQNYRIMYANSSDGLTWAKHGVVLDLGPIGSLDEFHAYHPAVLKTGEYEMWYAAQGGLKYSILYANSSNGLNWTKQPGEVALLGTGCSYGDAYVTEPAAAFYGGEYHMLYGRYDGMRVRTMHARSYDGLNWNEIGLAIDTGGTSDYDSYRANQCCLLMDGETAKVWYSAYNNAYWRIMYANLTAAAPREDLKLTWAPSPSADVTHYELFRESRPSAFSHPLERAHPEYYSGPLNNTPWAFQTECASNITAYGPKTGTDPPFFYLPEDNVIDLTLCLRDASGGWFRLVSNSDYGLDKNTGHVEVYTSMFTPGCTLHAWFNHSASKAMRILGDSAADVRACIGSDLNYYYVIRAVDKAGNVGYCADMAGKIGETVSASWNLLCDPFINGSVPIAGELDGLSWGAARTWDPTRYPNQWAINRPGMNESLNSLQFLGNGSGVWVHVSAPGIFATVGHVSNGTMHLYAGWNLVSYPHHEIMSVAQALAGLPWDSAAAQDLGAPYLLAELDGNSALAPGRGFWVRVTTDVEWNFINIH